MRFVAFAGNFRPAFGDALSIVFRFFFRLTRAHPIRVFARVRKVNGKGEVERRKVVSEPRRNIGRSEKRRLGVHRELTRLGMPSSSPGNETRNVRAHPSSVKSVGLA